MRCFLWKMFDVCFHQFTLFTCWTGETFTTVTTKSASFINTSSSIVTWIWNARRDFPFKRLLGLLKEFKTKKILLCEQNGPAQPSLHSQWLLFGPLIHLPKFSQGRSLHWCVPVEKTKKKLKRFEGKPPVDWLQMRFVKNFDFLKLF